MNFPMLIYEGPAAFARRSKPDAARREASMSAWPRYTNALQDAGVIEVRPCLMPPA